ncbi:hypothetical protein V1503_22125 [Bacillus sp. SCS-151]|uniref:hypothetical protein n=1 Tax=Nanhaiella sioensis TaxID=3115293 RepID=UPI00397BFF5C
MVIERIKVVPCGCKGTIQFCETCGGTGKLNACRKVLAETTIEPMGQTNVKQSFFSVTTADDYLAYSNIKQFLENLIVTVKMERKTYKITFTTI